MTGVVPDLAAPTHLPFANRHVAVLAAHPDDEIIGFGGQMRTVGRLSLIHLTDGVPSSRTARWHGFKSSADYGTARRLEMETAAALARIPIVWTKFGLPDMRVAFHLDGAVQRLAATLTELNPDIIVTHPYEGGHPDHDAAAFVCQMAVPQVSRPPQRWDMTSYHAGPGGLVTGRFLDDRDAVVAPLSDRDQALKRAMLDCFTSQRPTLRPFGVTHEAFRRSPVHDFTRPPHPGRLHYENRRRAMSGVVWRHLAARATEPPDFTSRLLRSIENSLLQVWISRN